MPAVIKLNLTHNHSLGTADSMKMRRISDEVVHFFFILYPCIYDINFLKAYDLFIIHKSCFQEIHIQKINSLILFKMQNKI